MTNKITVLEAVDWSIYHDQRDIKSSFTLVKGHVIGFVVAEDDEKIVLAPQWFYDDDTRCTLVVPQVCIIKRYDMDMPQG